MTKIVIAPDKFKGSLSGLEFCNIVEHSILKHCNTVEIIKCPLADGGDGTVDALNFHINGHREEIRVHDPLFRPINTSYLLSADKHTAFIEMSAASGLRLLAPGELNPLNTSTYGTGQLIKDAIDKGARHIILGIGGSATNDGGLGMACALGYRFFDASGKTLKGIGSDLQLLHEIDNHDVHPQLKDVRFEIACDVDNPLYGPYGAAFVYAPQKGADSETIAQLDAGLKNYQRIVKDQLHLDLQSIKGAGAAGGLGAGCIAFLNGELKSGIELLKNIADFDNKIKDADWLITGEGKLDRQTFAGKVIKGITDSLSTQKLAVFCGVSELSQNELTHYSIKYLDAISQYAQSNNDSVLNAGMYLEMAAESFALSVLK
ncbi:glycerate kinase [Carboxylicivirga sp. RSCT41]|uniref:glycerate kinase n=1 Tax=Carboxylicivirga agarovorans TaxID=3417570 RepID=UPI003D34E408